MYLTIIMPLLYIITSIVALYYTYSLTSLYSSILYKIVYNYNFLTFNTYLKISISNFFREMPVKFLDF